jgi:hypothetical protein
MPFAAHSSLHASQPAVPRRASWRLRTALTSLALAVASFAALGTGCGRRVGDTCNISADCGSQGTRVCDTSQPEGYCTQYGCRAGSCIDDAVCVLFGATPPGCPPEQSSATSRFGRSFCAKSCDSDDDCRAGYRCRSGSDQPWYASVLDGTVPGGVSGARACLPAPLVGRAVTLPSDDPICRPPVASDAPPSPTPTSRCMVASEGGAADAAGTDAAASPDAGADAAALVAPPAAMPALGAPAFGAAASERR